MESHIWLGLMSGSSLDGLDIACCSFSETNGKWKGEVLKAETYPFKPELESILMRLPYATALEFVQADAAFSRFCADMVVDFLSSTRLKPTAIASHGHTIFHKPSAGYTAQIGNGCYLAALTGLTVVSDFRTANVAAGGEGAPLVPGAERFLFSDYDACLNLGGIANVSFPNQDPFLGFDISPCNQLLNWVAGWLDKKYDHGGELARSGTPIPALLSALDGISYYQSTTTRSLGNEDIRSYWLPVVERFRNFSTPDVQNTLSNHISQRITNRILSVKSAGRILITGGGAFNRYLVEDLQKNLGKNWKVIVPDPQLVSFKEAYCFAFLGLKRFIGEINCFASVTGASSDHICGSICLP